jgi:hypothetical protein
MAGESVRMHRLTCQPAERVRPHARPILDEISGIFTQSATAIELRGGEDMFDRISIIVIAVMFSVLAVLGLWALASPANTGELKGGTVMVTEKIFHKPGPADADSDSGSTATSGPRGSARATADARATEGSSARASASASARSSSSTDASGKKGCSAESSSSAEARSGDEYAYDEDHDTAHDASGDCRAEATSSSRATVGRRSGE